MSHIHLGDPARHFWLTRSVARSMGLSLTTEIATGRLTEKGYADMVTRCRGCPHTASCEAWLAERQALSSSTPPGCRNAATLSELRQLH